MFVDLMVYDLDSKREGVHHTDFEDCLDEFLQKEFMVDSDEESLKKAAKIMIEIRTQL